jgi:hypothetical protein
VINVPANDSYLFDLPVARQTPHLPRNIEIRFGKVRFGQQDQEDAKQAFHH